MGVTQDFGAVQATCDKEVLSKGWRAIELLGNAHGKTGEDVDLGIGELMGNTNRERGSESGRTM